jgi:hypothetical protein
MRFSAAEIASHDVAAPMRALAGLMDSLETDTASDKSRHRVEHGLDALAAGLLRMELARALLAGQVIYGGRSTGFAATVSSAEGILHIALERRSTLEKRLARVADHLLPRFRELIGRTCDVATECIAMASYLSTSEIEYEGAHFQLRRPFSLRAGFQDAIWFIGFPELGISGDGATFSEAWRTFRMEIAATWDHLVHEQNERLTSDAQDLKARMLSAVEKVESVQ